MESEAPTPASAKAAIYFDGASSRKRIVELTFAAALEIREAGELIVTWPYDGVRRAESPPGLLRATSENAPSLARLEVRDRELAVELIKRCCKFDDQTIGSRGIARIVGWSFAALASIASLVAYGVPYAAERLTPLIPQSVERRIGEATDKQVRLIFGEKTCSDQKGQDAFLKLVNTLRTGMGLDASIDAAVLGSDIPNAIALPGGKIYLFDGLLSKADSPDEIAGVLAHELGHVRNRDSMRNMIYTGGTSFLIGLLFGDISGSGAIVFATRTLLNASHSRDVENSADTVTVDLMHKLGRSPKPMGELLYRVTGNQGDKNLSILASHPLSEERLARMTKEDRPPTGAPILSADEWNALKAICAASK